MLHPCAYWDHVWWAISEGKYWYVLIPQHYNEKFENK